MIKLLALLFLLTSSTLIVAQEFIIFGTVRDAAHKSFLPKARIQILDSNNDLLMTLISDEKGRFQSDKILSHQLNLIVKLDSFRTEQFTMNVPLDLRQSNVQLEVEMKRSFFPEPEKEENEKRETRNAEGIRENEKRETENEKRIVENEKRDTGNEKEKTNKEESKMLTIVKDDSSVRIKKKEEALTERTKPDAPKRDDEPEKQEQEKGETVNEERETKNEKRITEKEESIVELVQSEKSAVNSEPETRNPIKSSSHFGVAFKVQRANEKLPIIDVTDQPIAYWVYDSPFVFLVKGEFSTEEEAESWMNKNMSSEYPTAFVIQIRDGQRIK